MIATNDSPFIRCFSLEELEERLVEMQECLRKGFRKRRLSVLGDYSETAGSYAQEQALWAQNLIVLISVLERHITQRRLHEAH